MFTPAEIEALFLSLTVGLRAVLFGLPLAVLVAYALVRWKFPGRFLLDAIVHAPLVLPPVVVGYLLLLAFSPGAPLGGWLAQNFGLRFVFTSAGASLAAGVMAFPLMVRAVRLSLEAVDPGLEQAARSLGAGALDCFFTVTLPLMLPGILAGALLAFAAALGEFGAVITFAANIPGETQTLPLAIYNALQTPGGEGAALRLASLSIALALAALIVSEALVKRVYRGWGRA